MILDRNENKEVVVLLGAGGEHGRIRYSHPYVPQLVDGHATLLPQLIAYPLMGEATHEWLGHCVSAPPFPKD